MNQGKYVFGQLIAKDSMRDLMPGLEAHRPKYYHLGFGTTVSRRKLGTANEKRSYRIFEEFAYVLIDEARKSCYRDDFEIELEGNVYAFDSTTIDFCLSVGWWEEFRKAKVRDKAPYPKRHKNVSAELSAHIQGQST